MLDIMTIVIILIVVAVNVFFLLWLGAMPGKIARERAHPQADAIGVCGWLSLVTCFGTWPVAMIWAYTKPAHIAVSEAKEGKSP